MEVCFHKKSQSGRAGSPAPLPGRCQSSTGREGTALFEDLRSKSTHPVSSLPCISKTFGTMMYVKKSSFLAIQAHGLSLRAGTAESGTTLPTSPGVPLNPQAVNSGRDPGIQSERSLGFLQPSSKERARSLPGPFSEHVPDCPLLPETGTPSPGGSSPEETCLAQANVELFISVPWGLRFCPCCPATAETHLGSGSALN